MDQTLKAKIDELIPTLAAVRRDLHKHPESGWTEFRTASMAIKKMQSLGYQITMGADAVDRDSMMGVPSEEVLKKHMARAVSQGADPALVEKMAGGMTGFWADMDFGGEGPFLAVRFDMDCNDVSECADADHRPNVEGFASVNPGAMHACGHDGHMAIGLALAEVVASMRDKFQGKIRFIFQPAEEGVRGARPLAESGILDDLDYLYCGHLGCDIPGDEVVSAPEKFLCTTKVDFRFKGTASHAGMQPEVGRNALMAGSTASLALMALPRHGLGMTRVNVGYLRAGEGRNVIASTAEMQVEVRGETEAINTCMFNEAVTRAEGAAAMYGCTCEHEIMGEAIDFVPDLEVQENIEEAAKTARYCTKVSPTMNFNGSDDATVLIKRVQKAGGQGGYLVVGSELKAGHHQAKFDFEEKRLGEMFDIYRALVIKHTGA